ncbi:MAG: AMP-dependent synthetase [Anaerolineae bacterium]|nr:MAG: AMP-dependent synthetase [Anaerolineae bacterium]
MPRLLHAFLEMHADRQPEKTALVCGASRLTYAQVEAQANRLAHALREHGLQRGERVVLYLPNSVELAVGIFGVLKAGGVFVIVNHTTKAGKLAYILRDCGAQTLITGGRQNLQAQAALREIAETGLPQTLILTSGKAIPAPKGVRTLRWEDIQKQFPAERPPHVNIDLDLACLVYTSGSTGDPKGVMEGHDNVLFAAQSIIEYLDNRPEDIVFNALPLSFDYGLYQWLMVTIFGGTLVLERSFAFPAAALKKMAAERVTGFPGVPTIFAVLLEMDLSPYDLSHLRYLTNTAAALPPSHITALREKFPQATLFSMYGLTETKRTLYLPPDQLDVRPGSVGIPIPGTEAWLEDEQGNRLPPGSTGELVVRGRHVMRGYWNKPEATARRYRPGPTPGERLCYTGDLFRQDEEGYFYFLARKDDIIKSRGEKVPPKEIESVLYAIPGVREALVVGVPDPLLGEAIKAYIASDDPNLTEADVLRHCRAHLEDFMVPQSVEFRPALPRTSSGKLTRKGL